MRRVCLSRSRGLMKISKFLSIVASLQLVLPPVVAAEVITKPSVPSTVSGQSRNVGASPINLDLSSTKPTLLAGHLGDLKPLDIRVGKNIVTVTGSTLLTPAQKLAVYQVASTGLQTIRLGAGGKATGGIFSAGSNFTQYVESVVIPRGVTMIDNSTVNPTLFLSGNITNSGKVYVLSTNVQSNNAVIG